MIYVTKRKYNRNGNPIPLFYIDYKLMKLMSFRWNFENNLLTSQFRVNRLERFKFVVNLLNILRV